MTDPIPRAARSAPAEFEKQTFREGLKASAPAMPGIFAWGMVTGMAMVKSGLTFWQAIGMTFIVYAGSAQLAALPLMMAHASVWVIFATAMVVNLRFVIFAAALGPHFSHLPWYKRVWYGYFNADMMLALFPRRFPPETQYQPQGKLGFFTGVGYPNWWVWQSGSIAGILLGSRIPQSWGIGFAGTLALLAVAIPLIANSAALAGVAVAALTAVALAGLPYKLGLLVAVVGGMIAAMLVDGMLERRKERAQS
jgi:predicted branched-subunit amino acid permease